MAKRKLKATKRLGKYRIGDRFEMMASDAAILVATGVAEYDVRKNRRRERREYERRDMVPEGEQ